MKPVFRQHTDKLVKVVEENESASYDFMLLFSSPGWLTSILTPKPIPHNEAESAEHRICTISEDTFDYLLKIKDVGIVCRIGGDQREAFIGTI